MKIDGVTFDNVTISSCPHGEVLFDTPGTYSWVVPVGVSSVSVVAVGGGGGTAASNPTTPSGGGGGALRYVNNLAVTPGETITVAVGAGGVGGATYPATAAQDGTESSVKRSATVLCSASPGLGTGVGGSTGVGTGGSGGTGGAGGTFGSGGGGGAGGYSGNGGNGGRALSTSPTAGSGGGGGGGQGANSGGGGGGGGVGIWGQSSNGSFTLGNDGQRGGGGGGGQGGADAVGQVPGIGGSYGAGAGGTGDTTLNAFAGAAGGQGAVRVIWPGQTRSFPSTNVGRVADYGFDVVQPTDWMVDATNPASYLSGGSLIDISGQSLASGTTATVTSLVGAGISFPGTGVGFNHGNILGTIANSSWSFGYWVKFNNVTTAQTVMEKTSSNSTGWSVGIRTTGNLRMNIGSQLYNVSVAAELFTVGTWTHVVVTISSGGLVTNYINGANSNSVAFTAPVTSDSGSFYVGSNASSGFLNGSVGEAFFYRKELTAAEALQNYTNTKWKYGL